MSGLALVTGVNGFIAKHIAKGLLEAGYSVRGTVRSAASTDAVRASLRASGCDDTRLTFVEADLEDDKPWRAAADGCRFVLHVASPFPMQQPRDREALVPAARAGTIRVLDAALGAGVERVVMTSSMVAMMYRAGRPRTITVREGDWTDPEWPSLSAYIVSKTRAEQAAWQHMQSQGARDKLVVVNPGFVLGPTLDKQIGTSLGVIELILKGTYPALPASEYPVVDVRDLAELHVRALSLSSAAGRRLIAAGETISMTQMAAALRQGLGPAARRAPARTLPDFLVRALAMVDRSLKSVVPDIGTRPVADSGYVTEITGVSFRPASETVLAAGMSLIERGIVRRE
jgi:dihydroflavonol-4-reductase